MEVPACQRCNRAHAPFDDYFSVIAQIQRGGIKDPSYLVDRHRLSGVRNLFPSSYNEISTGGHEKWIKINGLIRQAVFAKVSHPEIHFVVAHFTARMIAAVWYTQTDSPLPVGTLMAANWSSNLTLLEREIPFELVEMARNRGFLEQGRRTSEGQFEYFWNLNDDLGYFVFNFHDACVTFGFLYGLQALPEMELKTHYFQVTERGIWPVNHAWPANIRERMERR